MKERTYIPRPVLGCAIGDALGKPFEEIPDHPAPPKPAHWDLEFLAGRAEVHGEYGVPPGHFTDDTQMTLALGGSLLQAGGFDRETTITAYMHWFVASGSNAPRGIGGTIRRTLEWVLLQGYVTRALEDLNESAVRHRAHPSARNPFDERYCGSGTAMRASPLGAWYQDDALILKTATEDAYLTHASIEAAAGSYAVARAVRLAIRHEQSPMQIVDDLRLAVDDAFPYTRVAAALELAHALARSDNPAFYGLKNTGDVAALVGSALAMFGRCRVPENARKHLYLACEFGGDTDTRCAVLGAILGAYWGVKAFPDALVDGVERRDELLALDEKLVRL